MLAEPLFDLEWKAQKNWKGNGWDIYVDVQDTKLVIASGLWENEAAQIANRLNATRGLSKKGLHDYDLKDALTRCAELLNEYHVIISDALEPSGVSTAKFFDRSWQDAFEAVADLQVILSAILGLTPNDSFYAPKPE